MVKYNYKGAAALFDNYYFYFCDPWQFDDQTRQRERRYFLRAFAHETDDRLLYMDYARDILESMNGCAGLETTIKIASGVLFDMIMFKGVK